MKRKSILVVDTNREFLNTTIEFLTMEMKIDVVTWAENSEEAVEKFERYSPDVVLMDLGTDKYMGVELSEWLKSLPNKPKVIVTSIYDNFEYRRFARLTGANGFIIKDKVQTTLPRIMDIMFPSVYEKYSFMLN